MPESITKGRVRQVRLVRRRRSWMLSPGTLVASAMVAMLAAGTLSLGHALWRRAPRLVAGVKLVPPAQSDALRGLHASSPRRSFYRHSVVPGGILTLAEWRSATADPVVAAHYSELRNLSPAPARLARAGLFFVSYRVGDQVFWTKRPVLVAAGEAVWQSGTHLVRARCGNRMSTVSRSPVSPAEPPTREFEVPIDDPPSIAGRPDLPPVPGSPIRTPAPPSPLKAQVMAQAPKPALPTFGAPNVLPTVPLPPAKRGAEINAEVPEPSSIGLLLLGAVLLTWTGRISRVCTHRFRSPRA